MVTTNDMYQSRQALKLCQFGSGQHEANNDLVYDRITRHNNPNIKNMSSIIFGEEYKQKLADKEQELLYV